MKWESKIDSFEQRTWKDKYLETCDVLDEKIEVNLYSCKDIEKYEIYVNYGIMYGIVYVHKDKAEALKEEIKAVIYEDYLKNGYDPDMPSDEFMKEFADKYKIDIPSDIFFDQDRFMESMLRLMDSWNLKNEPWGEDIE